MNKYKNLINNTVIFALGTFGSKVLVFLLMPLYTRLLTPAEYGQAGILVDTCNLILPVMYLSITEAIIRFGMDRSANRKDIFSIGIYVVLAGYAILLLFRPALKLLLNFYADMSNITFTADNPLLLIYLYVLTSALHAVMQQFVRASGLVRIFALDGIFTTFTTILFNIIFLVGFKMGVTGYVAATITADGISALCLFVFLRLYRFLKIRHISLQTLKAMLLLAVPLVPANVCWWVTNLSDRYLVLYYHGWDMTGIYEAAYKLPTIITLVSTIFTRAWELSAYTEYSSREASQFYSTVFKSYYSFIFMAASGLILIIKPLTSLMMNHSYYNSWQYAPFLLLATAFSCFVTFTGSIYLAAKKTWMSFFSTLAGALMNIWLNYLFIPEHGGLGAAAATFISYFAVCVFRLVDTRRYVKLSFQPIKMILCLLLLLAQSWIALKEIPYWALCETAVLLLIVAINFSQIKLILDRFLGILQRRRALE